MSERLYLFLAGAYILAGLYLGINEMIYAISGWFIFEAITDIRLTTMTQQLIYHRPVPAGLTVFQTTPRFEFDAYRAMRFMAAMMLGISFLLLKEYNIEVLWFIPWFMGFAIMGAGASGVCPMVLFLKWAGFK